VIGLLGMSAAPSWWLQPSIGAQSIGAHSIGALQRPDDDLISRIFSLVFLAFVLLWPVIQRKINEAQERQRERTGGGEPRRRPAPGRDALEDLFRGSAGDDDVDELELEPEFEARAPARPADADEPPPLRRPAPVRSYGEELVGDPFDDSRMSEDLVPDTSLRDVPREAALERGRFDEDAAAATLRRASFRSRPLSSASSGAPLGSSTGLASGVGVGAGSASREATRAALRRLERRYSPWQRAFVLREVLGPPRSKSLFDDPRR